MSKPDGRQPSPLPKGQLAPLPTQEALFGDVSKQMEQFHKQRDQLAQRDDAQREKLNLSLDEKIKQRQAAAGGGKSDAVLKENKKEGGHHKKHKGDKAHKDKGDKENKGEKKLDNRRRSRVERRKSVMPTEMPAAPKAK